MDTNQVLTVINLPPYVFTVLTLTLCFDPLLSIAKIKIVIC